MRKLALVLVPFVLAIAIPLGCLGCQPVPPVATEPAVKPPPLDVNYTVLYRDLDTALAYKGFRVRCRLGADEYKVNRTEGRWELHVWAGDRAAPPVLIFCCEDGPPEGPVTIVGVCYAVERDGVWRSPRADFRVIVGDCQVSRR